MKMLEMADGAPYYYTKVSCYSCCAGPYIVRYSHGDRPVDLPCPQDCGGRGLETRYSSRPEHAEIAEAETQYEISAAIEAGLSPQETDAILARHEPAEPATVATSPPEPDRRYGVYATGFGLTDCVIAAQKAADITGEARWVHAHLEGQECVVGDQAHLACFVVRPDPVRSRAVRT